MRLVVYLFDATRGAAMAAEAQGLGVTLRPMHPGTTDPRLALVWTGDVESAAASSILHHLRAHSDIDAAYVKPATRPA